MTNVNSNNKFYSRMIKKNLSTNNLIIQTPNYKILSTVYSLEELNKLSVLAKELTGLNKLSKISSLALSAMANKSNYSFNDEYSKLLARLCGSSQLTSSNYVEVTTNYILKTIEDIRFVDAPLLNSSSESFLNLSEELLRLIKKLQLKKRISDKDIKKLSSQITESLNSTKAFCDENNIDIDDIDIDSNKQKIDINDIFLIVLIVPLLFIHIFSEHPIENVIQFLIDNSQNLIPIINKILNKN